jgi:hypothetical protein
MLPFKFLDAYQKDDINIFFGRDIESFELYKKTKKSDLLLLYGLSGTGKTSLVQCGLSNRMKNSWLDIFIRRNTNINDSLKEGIFNHSQRFLRPKTTTKEALQSLYLDYFKTVYLIFDQFEELFIENNASEINEFINSIAAILNNDDLDLKVILILREEYIAQLDRFEEQIPTIFNNRMRLERMTKKTVQEVLTKMLEKGDIQLEHSQIIKLIVDNVTNDKGVIDLPYFQVYLDRLSQEAKEFNGQKIFDTSLIKRLGKLDDVLGDFLDLQVKNIGKELGNEEIAWKILKNLISVEGTKKPIERGKLLELFTHE